MTDRLSATYTSLIDYLRYQRECGAVSLELEPETLQTLARMKTDAAARAAAARLGVGTRAGTGGSGATAQKSRPVAAGAGAVDARAAAGAALEQIRERIAACRKCDLCQGRTQVVPGQGNPVKPEVMFIGEAPGAEEDRQGLAFVGRAGQLLTQMIAAMGYTREEVFIANICQCRPNADDTLVEKIAVRRRTAIPRPPR